MGRPLRRDVNGVEVFGAYTGDAGIKCEAYVSSANRTDVFIVRQRGTRTYLVHYVTGNTDVKARLVATTPAADGEMRLAGYVGGGATPVYLRKLTKHIATDFNNNQYKWALSNYQDSTGDVIRLTPFA